MRLGLVLEAATRAAPLSSLVVRAQAAEAAGLELLWLPDDDAAEPALIAAAAMSVHTIGVRLVAEVGAGMHPLAIAESAVVADNCSNGRLLLVLNDRTGEQELMDESLQLLLAAFSARPFRHRGERWQSPANRPENDGTEEQIIVTPPTAQPRMPVWLRGESGAPLAASYCLPAVVEETAVESAAMGWERTAKALGNAALTLSRPALWSIDVDASGDFDDDELVERLRAHQLAWGLDAAVLRLPRDCDDRAWARVARQLGTSVRPRVAQHQLPDGLLEHWRSQLPHLVAAAGLDSTIDESGA